MNALGINRGKSGNVSARLAHDGFDGYLITPTGLPYAEMEADDVVAMPLAGDDARRDRRPPAVVGVALPPRHLSCARPEIGAIVHTHAPFATTLACLDRGIPAFHYMIAIAGGSDIRCAPYATFGTQALSDHAVAALAGRRACLLAHHGMIATGPSLAGRAGAGGRGRDAGRDVLARAAGRRAPPAAGRRDARRAGKVRDLRAAAARRERCAAATARSAANATCPRRAGIARRAGVFRNDALNPRRGTPADSPTASARRRRTSPASRAARCQPEQLARPRDVGIAGRDVARPARDDLVRDASPRRRLERAHDLQHRVPAPGAEVDGRGPRRVRARIRRSAATWPGARGRPRGCSRARRCRRGSGSRCRTRADRSRRPTATCATKGIRLLGMPTGSSPMSPLACAPTGLK